MRAEAVLRIRHYRRGVSRREWSPVQGPGCGLSWSRYWPLLLVGLPSFSPTQEGSGLNLNRDQSQRHLTLGTMAERAGHTEGSSGGLGQLHHREVKNQGHAWRSSTRKEEAGGSEFGNSLIGEASFRPASAVCLKNKTKTNKQTTR